MMIFKTRLKDFATLCLGLSALIVPSSLAQDGLPADQRINGKLVWSAFEPQREVLQKSSAVIYTDEGSRIKTLYGVIVSEDGHVLTKASEIEGEECLSLRIGSKLYSQVEKLGVDDDWDVALLKITPEETLTPVQLGSDDDVKIGYWVVSNGSTTRRDRRVRVGIISAKTREISSDKSDVLLGVQLGSGEQELWKVEKVSDDSGAAEAGIQAGDVLIAVDGVKLGTRDDLVGALKGKQPGDKVSVQLMRGSEMLELKVSLSAREKAFTRNDQMSGGEDILSARRSEFPRVIHHDTPLSKMSVGGPLLNLDGVCIGMNIARASRVATFAIPARELRELIGRMIR
jgi:S1-C subfamily serine protease